MESNLIQPDSQSGHVVSLFSFGILSLKFTIYTGVNCTKYIIQRHQFVRLPYDRIITPREKFAWLIMSLEHIKRRATIGWFSRCQNGQ
jgi:hypothetical protein